jgi:putative transport protein
VLVAMNTMTLQAGDLVSVVASREDLPSVAASLGEIAPERIDLERSAVDYRRLFVSNREIAGRTLRDIDLPGHYGAIVTRVGRGDVEFLPTADTVVHLGDRLRVLASRGNITDVSAYLGDSFKALSEIDVLSFSLGILGGLALGLVPIPMPGGVQFHLGLAGGPLLVALALGKLGRTRSLVWTLPYNANLTLRQLGLLLFLAGIGTRAGPGFLQTFAGGGGAVLFAAGAGITFTTAFVALWAAHRLLKIPLSLAIGMVAGIHTQPAVLGFAEQQTKNEIPQLGYAAVYPVATIAKILLVQVLLALS